MRRDVERALRIADETGQGAPLAAEVRDLHRQRDVLLSLVEHRRHVGWLTCAEVLAALGEGPTPASLEPRT